MWLLFSVLKSVGFENITLGILFIGGCTLETHWLNAKNNVSAYTYRKNTRGDWASTDNVSIKDAIKEEDWDIITLQQGSGSSGIAETYQPFLRCLAKYVNDIKPKSAQLYWQMTWAYQGNSTHDEFPKYQSDQLAMFNAIVSCVKKEVMNEVSFQGIIPTGTAIQNFRTSSIGDNLTRDGYHLNMDYGRYVAALTWMSALTGISVYKVSYVPMNVTAEQAMIAKESASNAIKNPLRITKSTNSAKGILLS